MPKTTENQPRILLCDPNAIHRTMLKSYMDQLLPLSMQPEESSCYKDAYHKIVETPPKLVVLDVSGSCEEAFELLDKFPERHFQIIFTTSQQTFPVKVFSYEAVGYLFKPIETIPLARALETFHTREQLKQLSDKSKDHPLNQKIVLRTADEFILIDLTDIIRLESDGSYTTFYQADGSKSMIARHLKEFESLLPADHFFRIHASHIIRLHFVKKYMKEANEAVMCDGSHVPVSRRRKDEFIKRFMALSIT